jgi:hypothetical protein
MSDTVIRVENISKLYRLGEVGTGSLAHDVNRWWHRVRGKEDPYLKIGEVNDRTKPAARAVATSELLVTSENQSAEGGTGAQGLRGGTESPGRLKEEQLKVGPKGAASGPMQVNAAAGGPAGLRGSASGSESATARRGETRTKSTPRSPRSSTLPRFGNSLTCPFRVIPRG